MNDSQYLSKLRGLLLILLVCLVCCQGKTFAHPLGNFTINQFTRLTLAADKIKIHHVVDLAEIPTFQELQIISGENKPSQQQLNDYVAQVAGRHAENLVLLINGQRLPLSIKEQKIALAEGAGKLQTLRLDFDLEGKLTGGDAAAHQLHFENNIYRERIGWHEVVIVAEAGTNVYNSSAFGSAVTDELRAYPQDMLSAPLDERTAELFFSNGAIPSEAAPLRARDGRPVQSAARDRLAELIAVPDVTPTVALLGLLFAAALGAVHAFSPGHGKTVVGAYLVGSRGTARHAAFLGLTVTITHTIGVFALGLVTLYASQYIVPEKLFPVLSFVSGAIVLALGASLFVRRLVGALAGNHDGHTHSHTPTDYQHSHDDLTLPHSHDGGRPHSHLPPGADGSKVTWRSLLALGISGGLLPCPSALVVLLSAISLHRVGYGLALVFAFSIGLAATLTTIGLLFVYAGRRFKSPSGAKGEWLVRVLPVLSSLVIACVGAAICYEAAMQADFQVLNAIKSAFTATNEVQLSSIGGLALLGLGLAFGLKHATEIDHVMAVSTIVSEHRNVFKSALVGALWGAGHTASLMIVGIIVLALRITIPELVANWLEFGVALMIIWLGVAAVLRSLRDKNLPLHHHQHPHDDGAHAHFHFHENPDEHTHALAHTHAVTKIGIKPLLVGAMHGLAGSAALTLLVLTQINSVALGLLYLAIFGFGSIIGMLIMSGLIGLPFALTSGRVVRLNYGLQTVAGLMSVAFGIWYAYQTGISSGLVGALMARG